MRYLIVVILTCFCELRSGYAEPETLSWNAVTTLKTDATIAALNAQANNAATNETERSKAIFALFANYIKPGQTAAEVHRVLTDTAWVKGAQLFRMGDLAGSTFIEMTTEDSVFCLGLFPHKKKWSDWPSASAAPQGVMAETAPETHWWLYLRLSGSQLQNEDALAFLRGEPVAGNPKIIEFALCLPHPTSPGRLAGRIERFSKYGIHAYDPWREDRPTTAETNNASPLRR